MTELEFKAKVEADFGLTYKTEKSKHAYDMVIWQDDSGGSVAGSFAGHSHNCRVPHFEYKGWVYALVGDKWFLCRDGQSGWRQGENPFPNVPEDLTLTTW